MREVVVNSTDQSFWVFIEDEYGVPQSFEFDQGHSIFVMELEGATDTLTLVERLEEDPHADSGFASRAGGWHEVSLADSYFTTVGKVFQIGGSYSGYRILGETFKVVSAAPDMNVVSVNGTAVTTGVVRFTVLDTGVLMNGTLRLVKGDTRTAAYGNPIVFESEALPDLTSVVKAALTIRDSAEGGTIRLDHLETTAITTSPKKITFDATAANLNIPIGDDYVYDLELWYDGTGVAHSTPITGESCEILTDVS